MDAINWHTFLFLLMALVACSFAVAVAVTGNIVRMAFYLVLSLGGVAGLFFLAGADFLGGMQLMIYVGGTMVLLVFGVMLTARGPATQLRTSGPNWIVALIVGGSLLAVLLQTAFSVDAWNAPGPRASLPSAEGAAPTAAPLGMALVGSRTDRLDWAASGQGRGMAGYLLPFEIVSVHLVVVLVGAAYLARRKKEARGRARENSAAPVSPLPQPDLP